ncbi:putative N-acyl homoserine lactonase AttM [Sclerotinia borealis F-4128]|uniref:Putative N-acyl homoserine lactonase AttM n=1 Tax=Sclerotinia borealis (strain F-4128) TaxID=1432307 RepID=W9CWC2_SCLBF|nr:putative N-acyl homoserine lactonase AttM [Sclerotinia borealis F-4128]
MPKSVPDLRIPPSSTTVGVRIIDTTTRMSGIPLSEFVSPAIPGHTHLSIPAYSFLIEHSSSRSLLPDLGVRKNWENLAPALPNALEMAAGKLRFKRGYVNSWKTMKYQLPILKPSFGVTGTGITPEILVYLTNPPL